MGTRQGGSTAPGPIGRSARDGERISIGLGERPALLLAALAGLLERAGLEVRCTATTPGVLEHGLRRGAPQLVLIDASLGNGEGPLEFVDGLHRAAPDCAIVILVEELTPALAHAALDRQVAGVVLGSAPAEDLAASLEQVAAGHAVFPAGWLAAVHRAEDQSMARRLSARQMEVLELVAAGLDNGRIAQRLHISRNTVKFHVRVIYERLGVTNRVEAARALGEDRAGLTPAARTRRAIPV